MFLACLWQRCASMREENAQDNIIVLQSHPSSIVGHDDCSKVTDTRQQQYDSADAVQDVMNASAENHVSYAWWSTECCLHTPDCQDINTMSRQRLLSHICWQAVPGLAADNNPMGQAAP